jgi:hypothetical protein
MRAYSTQLIAGRSSGQRFQDEGSLKEEQIILHIAERSYCSHQGGTDDS